MVLFLFVIMLLGVESLRTKDTLPWQQPLAIILTITLIAEAAYIIVIRPATFIDISTVEVGFGSPRMIGEVLFETYLLPFEVTSVLLLVAMIGAIVLTRRNKREANT